MKGCVIFAFVAVSSLIYSCSNIKKVQPAYSLNEVSFVIEPRLEKRGDKFFLVYQVTTTPGHVTVRYVIDKLVTGDKAYFYFLGRVSFPEYDHPVARDLTIEGLDEFAEKNMVFWLNSDRTEIKLETKTGD